MMRVIADDNIIPCCLWRRIYLLSLIVNPADVVFYLLASELFFLRTGFIFDCVCSENRFYSFSRDAVIACG